MLIFFTGMLSYGRRKDPYIIHLYFSRSYRKNILVPRKDR